MSQYDDLIASNFHFLFRVLCASHAAVSPTLTSINLDHNIIESITTDPFQYCQHLKSVSIAYNSVPRLAKGNLQ